MIGPPRAAPDAPARARAGTAAFALGLALLSALAAGYALWRQLSFEREHGDRLVAIAQSARTQSDALAALTRELEAGVDRDAALERRIAGNETVNRSLREEVLGLGERARIVEDAVASLAQSRLEGAQALRLNEAELLLRLGAARLALFRDAAGAAAAYRLADAQLAALDDASLAGVRQTIAAELAQLETHGGPGIDRAIAELDAVAAAIPALPTRSIVLEALPAATDGDGYLSKLGRAIHSLVRVRRVDESPRDGLAPLTAETARAALGLELALAKAALVAHDDARFRAALGGVRESLARSFDDGDERVVDALARIARLEDAAAARELPAQGRALESLVNLRATRAVAGPAATLRPERVASPDAAQGAPHADPDPSAHAATASPAAAEAATPGSTSQPRTLTPDPSPAGRGETDSEPAAPAEGDAPERP